jgi:pyrroloquinoline-quinone synthase
MNSVDLSCCIEEALILSKYQQNPYFEALRQKTFEKEDFLETQIQFYFAVTFFSRPMAALAGKIPTTQQRLEIIRNIFEEHGEGDPTCFHEYTFSTLLKRLDVDISILNQRTLWPEVRTFNTLLVGACVMDHYLVGTAVLGIIERMFADISYWIGQELVQNHWLALDQVIHYSLHEKLDIKHSEDFFEVLKKPWESEENRYLIYQGLLMGSYAFNQLYEGLYQARKRRGFQQNFINHYSPY